MQLALDEITRYSPQLKLKQIGPAGQLTLKNTKVLCIGAGGLGSALLLYLAAAGLGKMGIVDDDSIELSNLNRQILYKQSHIGNKKAVIAKQQLTALNPHVDIRVYDKNFNADNAHELINQYDIITDCSDNFATRYLINDVCYELDKPYVFASMAELTGQCALFLGKHTPCFRCVYPVQPMIDRAPDCSGGGVLGVLPGLLGIMQATEVIKWALKLESTLGEHLLVIDILKMHFRQFRLTKNPDCLLCGFGKK